jgi:chromosomal replication initiator protein
VGKTHLLQAICAETRQQYPGLIAIYVWAEEFTTGFLEALRGGGLPSFRHKFRHVDLLAIDDVQFLLGKHCTQRELLYTIDTLLREGKQVVLASDRRPEALAEFGDDFVARVRSGMVCEIQWPDEEIRLPLVQQLCRRLGLDLHREIQEYIATHVHGHAREFLGALRRIHAFAHFRGKPITLELAQEALSDFVGSCARPIRLKDVANVICDTFQLQPEELAGPSRAQQVAQPRLLAMWLARKYTRAGLNEICRFFGRRSHSVVLSAQQKVERWLAEGKSVSAGGTTIPVQQLIKELERRLKAS